MVHTLRVTMTHPPPKVRTLELPDAPVARGRRTPQGMPRSFAVTSRTSWLIAPAFLAAALVGVGIVFRAPEGLLEFGLGGLFVIGLLWALISIFFPGRPDVTCSECGAESLERLSPDAVVGLRCGECGHVDESASGWMFAEQEGIPLEGIVLENRRARREAALKADSSS